MIRRVHNVVLIVHGDTTVEIESHLNELVGVINHHDNITWLDDSVESEQFVVEEE